MKIAPPKWKLEAGTLRNPINICKDTLTPDGMGGNTVSTEVVLDGWACIRPLTGYEFNVAQQQKMAVTTAIDLRYTTGITNDMWVVDTDTQEEYAIRAVLDIEKRRRKLVLWCEQRKDLK